MKPKVPAVVTGEASVRLFIGIRQWARKIAQEWLVEFEDDYTAGCAIMPLFILLLPLLIPFWLFGMAFRVLMRMLAK